MNRATVTCGIFAAVMFSLVPRALARPREVRVVTSTHRCVDADALARAIHRDTSLPVRVVKGERIEGRSSEGAQDETGYVLVEVKGRDEELTVELRGSELQVSQPLRASACETASDVAAAFVASILAPPPAIVVPPAPEALPPVTAPPEKDGRVAERAALMVEDLQETANSLRPPPTILRILGGAGAATLSAFSFYDAANNHEPLAYLRGASTGAWALGTVASFLAPDDYIRTITDASLCVGIAGIWFGNYRGAAENEISPYVLAGITGSLFVEAALLGVGAAIRRPVSAATLAAHHQSIRSPEQRSALTADQLARIEADFRRSSSPLPRWVLAAPLIAGGGLVLGASIADPRGSDASRILHGLGGAAVLGFGVFTLYPLTGYGHYERLLERNGLQASVQAAPGQRISLQVQGTF
jgi:hypothetical protein